MHTDYASNIQFCDTTILPWHSLEVYPAKQYGQHHSVIMKHTTSNTVVYKLQKDTYKDIESVSHLTLITTSIVFTDTSRIQIGKVFGISGYADVSRVSPATIELSHNAAMLSAVGNANSAMVQRSLLTTHIKAHPWN